jgi:hypothetical protein
MEAKVRAHPITKTTIQTDLETLGIDEVILKYLKTTF